MAVAVADQAVRLVEVVAPSDLPEGFEFEAVAEGQSFRVTVPAGGVSQGQRFSAPFLPDAGESVGYTAPIGRWKDGLCDCCLFGCCHPALWMAICCRLALLGQVQNRLRLNWLGNRASPRDYSPFKVLLGVSVGIFVCSNIFSSLMRSYVEIDPNNIDPIDPNTKELPPGFWGAYVGYHVFALIVTVFWVYVAVMTRKYIREKNEIPETTCTGCEDCCCSFFCGCCTVAQMARHTAEYETYVGQCCSETGLPVTAPRLQMGSGASEIV